MTKLELIDKKNQLEKRGLDILEAAEKEERKLNKEEQMEYDGIVLEMRELSNKINQTNIKTATKMEKKDFSLIKAIRSVANNQQLDEASMAVINQGKEEMRKSGVSFSGQIQIPVEQRATVEATVQNAGKETVATDKLNILGPIYQNMVLAKAGAHYITGLVGTVSLPKYSGSTVGWKGEIDEAADGAGTFSEVTFSPKRLTAYIDVSKQFLIQDSVGAEELLRNDLVKAISTKLEETILGNAAGDATKPAGIFNGAESYDFTTNAYQKTVDMESTLDGFDGLAEKVYIVSPSIKAELRKQSKDTGSGQLTYMNGEINGITTLCSSKAQGIVLGDFSNYYICQWGAVDLVVDPYTQASKGCVRLVVNAYFDAGAVRDEAFVAVTEA